MTGVQTCALPISRRIARHQNRAPPGHLRLCRTQAPCLATSAAGSRQRQTMVLAAGPLAPAESSPRGSHRRPRSKVETTLQRLGLFWVLKQRDRKPRSSRVTLSSIPSLEPIPYSIHLARPERRMRFVGVAGQNRSTSIVNSAECRCALSCSEPRPRAFGSAAAAGARSPGVTHVARPPNHPSFLQRMNVQHATARGFGPQGAPWPRRM